MKLNIEFWKGSTKKAFNNFKKALKQRSDFTEREINEWLETLYDAVSSEYGN